MFEELRAIQRDFGYLPSEQLKQLAEKIRMPISQIHAVASFYPHFHLSPPPKVDVRVCADMSCHLRQSDQVRSALDSAFQGTDSKEISIRDVSCLGRCDQAPAIMVNDRIYSRVNSREAVAWRKMCSRVSLFLKINLTKNAWWWPLTRTVGRVSTRSCAALLKPGIGRRLLRL